MLEGTKNFRNESMLRKQNAKNGYAFILKFCLGITLDKFEFPGMPEDRESAEGNWAVTQSRAATFYI